MSRQLARGLCAVAAGIALSAGGLAGTASAARAPASSAAAATFSGRLYDVAALSRSDAWAVGLHPNSSLIVHWNGKAWTQSLAGSGYFIGVAADSADDAWAVGGTNWFRPSATLIEHWTGTAWTHVASPSPAPGGFLNAVAAVSADDAWAVGQLGPGPGIPSATTPLIEHWNGKTWTVVPSPNPPASYLNALFAVSATGRGSAFAVGTTDYAATLIARWNGKAWS